MDGRAASQTITDKIPYLVKKGVRPQVLSTISGEKDKNIPHRQVIPWGPSGLIFDLRFLLKRQIGKGVIYKLTLFFINVILIPFLLIEKVLFRLPSQASWALPSALIGIYRAKKGSIDLVYSTGGAWSGHLAGFWIWKITKVPWIVELHDPMVSVYELGSKRIEIRILLWLERKISKHSTIVWWFTEEAENIARRRNKEISEKGFNALAGANPPKFNVRYLKRSKICFSHFGSLNVGRSLYPFLTGINRLIESNNINKDQIEVNIYGGQLDDESREAIRKYGLESIFMNHGRIEANDDESGRLRIMNYMAKSDVLLVMHGEDDNCKEYIPSKFFEYLYAKRPVLAYNFLNPQFKHLLKRSNCYEVSDPKYSSRIILEIIEDWKNDNLKIPSLVISTENLVEKIIYKLDELKE